MTIKESHTLARTFLIECYAPGLDRDLVVAAGTRARAAAAALRDAGRAVEYLGALLVPQDEVVFHLFTSADAAVARKAAGLAQLRIERVVESILVADEAEPARLPER